MNTDTTRTLQLTDAELDLLANAIHCALESGMDDNHCGQGLIALLEKMEASAE